MERLNPILLEMPEVIESARLVIRPPMAGDGAALYQAVVESLAQLRAWPSSMPWALREPDEQECEVQCREGFATYKARLNLPFMVFTRHARQLVGGISLHNIDWSVPKMEIGYWCRLAFQGQGLTTEAVAAVTQAAATHLCARRITALPDVNNTASRVVLEKCGYLLEGVQRQERANPDGRLCDTAAYAFLS